MMHVRLTRAGDELLDATVRARYFVAALSDIVKASNAVALVDAGMAALRRSALPRLVLMSEIDEANAQTLVRSLPRSIVELLLPGVGIGHTGAKIVGNFLKGNASTDLRARLTALTRHRRATQACCSLTTLELGINKIGDPGAIGLGEGLKVDASLTTLILELNQIGDAGAIGLDEGLKVSALTLSRRATPPMSASVSY
uniref:Uncharacterized protein n=1 Tax=Diacronema lutheri TaxID=2081491 RepID=A0A7R9YK48_DIALT|mmetsp:Transcript_19036/g.59321  ORF Transcript_19036/g.59321 Transcript_19036/m.59321 type:complete len:199 (+) Transcript_19036:428-1024(+)